MFPSRERYKSSKDQLEKGRLMLEDVMKRLVDVPGWSHLGLICFTEIDSREIVRTTLRLSQEEMKVMGSFKTFSNIFTSCSVHSDERRTVRPGCFLAV